jgi:hypothetical protein
MVLAINDYEEKKYPKRYIGKHASNSQPKYRYVC